MTVSNVSIVNLDAFYSSNTLNSNVSIVNMDSLYSVLTNKANVSAVNMDVMYQLTYGAFNSVNDEVLYNTTPNVKIQTVMVEVLLKYPTSDISRRRPVYVATLA